MDKCLSLSELLISFLKTVNIELRDNNLVLLEGDERFRFDYVISDDKKKYYAYSCPSAELVFYGTDDNITGLFLAINGLVYNVFDEVWENFENIRRSLYINHAEEVGLTENGIMVEPICSQLFSSTGIGDYKKGPRELSYIGCSTSGIELSIDDYSSKIKELSLSNYNIALSKAINKAYANDDKLREAFLRSCSVISDTYDMMTEIPLLYEDVLRGDIDKCEEMASKEYHKSRSLAAAMELKKISENRNSLELYIKKYGIDGGEKSAYHKLYSDKSCATINM